MNQAPAASIDDESTTALGDWFATALFWKPQAALLVNTRTMIPVFTPLAPAGKLLDRAPEAIAAVLRAQGVPMKGSLPNWRKCPRSESRRRTTVRSSA